MTSIHIADAQSAKRAQDAIRDILYLYRDLVAYDGIVGDHDLGTFEPWAFLRATRYGGWATDEDLKLLHEGSAVALVCDLVDELDQRGRDVERFRRALDAGEFDELPLAKTCLRVGLAEVPKLLQASRAVYNDYVRGYLRTLVE